MRFASLYILTATCALQAGATSIFELSYTSSPTAYVGAGKSETIRPGDGWNFSIESGPARGYLGDVTTDYVSVRLSPTANNPNPYGFWDVEFATPVGQKLAVGSYSATRFPFQPDDSAGMNFDGMGRGDNALHGTFQILSVGFDGNGRVNSFAADFEQWDEYIVDAWNRGSIRYNYDDTATTPPDPVTPTPEPGTMALGLLAIPVLGHFFKLRRA